MSDTLREAALEALEALEEATTYTGPSITASCNAAIAALRAALAAAVAEPVAYLHTRPSGEQHAFLPNETAPDCPRCVPLYAAPQPEAAADTVEIHQFRKFGCTDWYDGSADHEDGGGPYEERVLYAAPPQREPGAIHQWRTSWLTEP